MTPRWLASPLLAVAAGLSLSSFAGNPPEAIPLPGFVNDGEAGFVVSHIEFALSHDADKTGACPDGLSQSYRSKGDTGAVFLATPDLQQKAGETDADFAARVRSERYGGRIQNLCTNPELSDPDPDFRTVTGKDVPAYGINLTGHVSRRDENPPPGSCAYDSFVGMNGEEGVDNQFFRVIGCTGGYQSTAQGNSFATEMLTGSWGILIHLSGIDDLVNDDHIEVGIYANGDPIQLSPTRNPLSYATYLTHQDPRYHAKTTGRIVDGVLITDPVDVSFPWVVNAMFIDRVFKDARVQLTFDEEGLVEGYLAGYAPVDNAYDVNFGFRNAVTSDGELGPFARRANSAIGKADALGYTCPGVYHALHEHADGHPDPDTGQCTSISTQFRIQAMPAFIVETTASRNEELK